jgi:hypothetical protein
MADCESARSAHEGKALEELRGVEIEHELHLVVRDWLAWTAVSERLSLAGADIHTLHLARNDRGFSVCCRLKRVSPEAARALTTALLNEGIAERGEIEHLVLAKAGRNA